MTVCVGAIAEKSKAIVMVADKSVTYSGGTPMESDTSVRKIVPIGTSGWYALIAGDSTFALDVVYECEQILFSNGVPSSGSEMMRHVKAAYQQCRETDISDRILKPRLLTKDLYTSRPSSLLPLPLSLTDAIDREVKDYSTSTRLLICGFDDGKVPHIFSICDPGVYDSHDLLGFHAVGIGQETALARLLSMDAEKADPLAKSLYGAFDAKVNAEIIQGIGYSWDAEILVVGNRKAFKVPRNIISLMDRMYEGFPRSPFDADKSQMPQEWWNRLGDFITRIMPSSKMPSISTVTGKHKIPKKKAKRSNSQK
jgi:20S proteasome alpha/beta subunit